MSSPRIRPSVRTFATAASAALSISILCGGCGGTSTADTVRDAASPDADASIAHALPPPAPSGPAAVGAGVVVLALRSLWLGEKATPDGFDLSGWKDLGYDLDGLVTAKGEPGSCKPYPGGVKGGDGMNGVDNSFGANLVPAIMATESSSVSQQMTDTIGVGGFTLLVHLHGVGSGSEYFPVSAHAGLVAPLPMPDWDGNDVRDELLGPGQIDFAASWVTGDVWVSGPSDGVLALPLSAFESWGQQVEPFLLGIHRPIVTMHLAEDRKSADSGIIAGLLDVDEFNSSLSDYICPCHGPPSCYDFQYQIAEMADSLIDGSVDPTRQCDAISIGVGFAAVSVKSGALVPHEQPPPCP